jgi:hypothetical protein
VTTAAAAGRSCHTPTASLAPNCCPGPCRQATADAGAKALGVTRDKWAAMVKNNMALVHAAPEALAARVDGLAQIFGCDRSIALRAAQVNSRCGGWAGALASMRAHMHAAAPVHGVHSTDTQSALLYLTSSPPAPAPGPCRVVCSVVTTTTATIAAKIKELRAILAGSREAAWRDWAAPGAVNNPTLLNVIARASMAKIERLRFCIELGLDKPAAAGPTPRNAIKMTEAKWAEAYGPQYAAWLQRRGSDMGASGKLRRR